MGWDVRSASAARSSFIPQGITPSSEIRAYKADPAAVPAEKCFLAMSVWVRLRVQDYRNMWNVLENTRDLQNLEGLEYHSEHFTLLRRKSRFYVKLGMHRRAEIAFCMLDIEDMIYHKNRASTGLVNAIPFRTLSVLTCITIC
jgi:hypothetical protein